MIPFLIQPIIAFLSAISGAVFTSMIKLNHRRLCSLISFSAGALMGAALFALLPEAGNSISLIEVSLSISSGYFLFFFISKYYSHICPACSASHFDEKTTKKFSEIFLTLFTALSFHSFLDGIAITTSVEQFDKVGSVFLAILIHKFPEGLALASLMFGAGYSKIKVLLYVALVEITTVIGGLVGFYFLQEGVSPLLMGILLAHISGGFIYLSFHAIFGEMLKNHTVLVLSNFIFGALIILLSTLYI
jgi:zinc transporter ZupT